MKQRILHSSNCILWRAALKQLIKERFVVKNEMSDFLSFENIGSIGLLDNVTFHRKSPYLNLWNLYDKFVHLFSGALFIAYSKNVQLYC
jgi:hypothetical protein